MTRRRGARGGQSLVELAIVLPLLLLLLFGVIDFARVYNAQFTLHRVTRSAVSYGTMMRGVGSLPTDEDIRAKVLASVASPLVTSSLRIDRLDVSGVDGAGRQSVLVSVSYDVPILTPLVSAFFAGGVAVVSSTDQRPYMVSSQPVASVSPPPAPPTPPFTITATSDLLIHTACSARLKVLSKQLVRANGTQIPVTAKLTTNGTSFHDLFGGAALAGGEEQVLSDLKTGAKLALSARAFQPGTINKTYQSNAKDAFDDYPTSFHQYVLANGDTVPATPGLPGQVPLIAFLAPFIDDTASRMALAPKEVAVLFEFSTTFNSAQTDYRDLALLLQFYDPATETAPQSP